MRQFPLPKEPEKESTKHESSIRSVETRKNRKVRSVFNPSTAKNNCGELPPMDGICLSRAVFFRLQVARLDTPF